MPMRNPGRYLAAAISSVLDQSGGSLELIVIDDGCSDGSREWVEALGDPRIVLLDGPQAGISACLNLGLARARGAVVMRCDADDLYPAGRIASQRSWLDAHPDFIAVCGPFRMVAPDGSLVAEPLRHLPDELLDGSDRILDGRLKTHLCSFAIRRDAVALAGEFRSFFETAEDIDFTLRLAQAGPIGYQPSNAYDYRLHGTSITHTQASVRRRFFETTAYEMSRERLREGTDSLMRGMPPQPPAEGVSGHADGAALHMAQLLVGECWAAFRNGRRRDARRAALRAIRLRFTHRDAWKALLLVSVRPIR
jgi:glycosyltransferase involved in cell wall biosynthesis